MDNYFQLLNMIEKDDIDHRELTEQYFTMQAKYHPDISKNIKEKQRDLTISIDLNKAYSVLKDDLARAEYLLSLNGINLDQITVKQAISPEQLKIIWDELELVENIDNLPKLEQMLNDKMRRKQELITGLIRSFQNHNMQDAVDYTIRFKYQKNLLSNIRQKILVRKSIQADC